MTDRPLWKTLLAYGIVYFVWGSTFLAIRVGVLAMPPLLCAAIRFAAAGVLLYVWTRLRGEAAPRRREWLSIVVVAALIFVGDYGLLFWAETIVPSGITAVMMATIPAFIAVGEVFVLRTRRFTVGLALALAVGLAGVAVLTIRSANLGGTVISATGAGVLLISAINWSVASILTRKLPLPQSKMVSSGAQMLVGGVLLAIAAGALGEFPLFHPAMVPAGAWVALVYLIIAGSIMGFTAYLWLIHHESPTRVGTYAYVNPVIAMLIGHWFGGEELGVRAVIGSALILASVVAIIASRANSGASGVQDSGDRSKERAAPLKST